MEGRKIFAFPYAGGSSLSYLKWASRFPEKSFFSLEYKGHGLRISEESDPDMRALAEDALHQLVKMHFAEGDILYGHSMGGMAAWMCAGSLAERYGLTPGRVVISCCRPPESFHIADISYSDEDDLWRKLLLYGHIKDDAVMKDYLLPILKADYQRIRTYRDLTGGSPISAPVTMLYSSDDPATLDGTCHGWSKRTTSDYEEIGFDGNHFFFDREENLSRLLELLNEYLK